MERNCSSVACCCNFAKVGKEYSGRVVVLIAASWCVSSLLSDIIRAGRFSRKSPYISRKDDNILVILGILLLLEQMKENKHSIGSCRIIRLLICRGCWG
mmetsp:Transcript_31709/g.42129  ORF Transcript_31709/g.42129 Transcript_31709/m.42129 type:complete len:99 (+) Transcript_31709:749-1045(+)